MPPLYWCSTEGCAVLWFANATGVCRGCGAHGIPVKPKGWSNNGPAKER